MKEKKMITVHIVDGNMIYINLKTQILMIFAHFTDGKMMN